MFGRVLTAYRFRPSSLQPRESRFPATFFQSLHAHHQLHNDKSHHVSHRFVLDLSELHATHVLMTCAGSLVFCTDCGNLLDGSAGKQQQDVVLTCSVCGAHNKDTSSKTVVTVSKPTAFPSSLRAKRSEVQTISEADVQTTSVIAHPCEKCGREEVRYYTQQLRSADEGSTVFYECDCGHKYAYSVQLKSRLMLIAILQMEHEQLKWALHISWPR